MMLARAMVALPGSSPDAGRRQAGSVRDAENGLSLLNAVVHGPGISHHRARIGFNSRRGLSHCLTTTLAPYRHHKPMATKNPMSDDTATNTDEYTLPDLTGFQRDLLRMVAALGSPKGLAIKAALEDGAHGEIFHGRLYPNLDELVEKGLIEKGERDRRTNYYEITSRGQRELESYANWVASSVSENGQTGDSE